MANDETYKCGGCGVVHTSAKMYECWHYQPRRRFVVYDKRRGKVMEFPKAIACPSCGHMATAYDVYRRFSKFLERQLKKRHFK